MKRDGRYSKVYRRMWVDEKVKRLSPPPPSGFTLFQRFLCGPELTNVPGLFPAWEAGLAQALKWDLEAFRIAYREVYTEGLVEADWEAGLIWVPNAIRHNEPESPKVVESWAKTFLELPDCQLLNKAKRQIRQYLAEKDKPEPWLKAIDKAMGKPIGKPIGKPTAKGYSPPIVNQEQEQEQEQEIQKSFALTPARGPSRPTRPATPSAERHASIQIPEAEPTLQSAPVPLPATPEPERPNPPAEPNVVPSSPAPPTRRQRISDDWMVCPIEELAGKCRANQHDAAMTPVADRPEVKALNEQWCKAVGLTARKLGAYAIGNKPLVNALETLETTSAADVQKLCEQAARDPWCTGKKGFGDDPPQKRGLGCLTANIRAKLLAAWESDHASNNDPGYRRVMEMLEREKAKMAG